MSEANAIQFGLDQLLEAPTPKLISFIHWYYWSQNVAGLVVFYTIAGGTIVVHEFGRTNIIKYAIQITLTILITLATVAALGADLCL